MNTVSSGQKEKMYEDLRNDLEASKEDNWELVSTSIYPTVRTTKEGGAAIGAYAILITLSKGKQSAETRINSSQPERIKTIIKAVFGVVNLKKAEL